MGFAGIYVAEFAVQSVIRAEPALAGRAIALIDGIAPAWKVVAANEAALRAGIAIGMARTSAEQFAGIEIRQRSETLEKSAHAALLDLGWSFSPRMEDTAADSDPPSSPNRGLGGPIMLDLTGLTSVFGDEKNIAQRLAKSVRTLGLVANVAISANLETALHAARGFSGITLIAAGEEAQRLACLPVGVLEPSPETLETLDLWGVRTLGALAALPLLELSERLGQEGVQLHEWARGAGVRAMVLAEPSTSFEEELELDEAVEELEPLSFLLGRLLDQLCARLAARSLAISTIHLRLALDLSERKDIQVRNDNSRQKKAVNFYERTLTLPVAMRNSKMLLNLLRLKLQGDPPKAPIEKIFMTAEAAKPRAMQGGLFRPASPDPEKLELTMARLANLVGEANIGSPQLVDTHRPDAFLMEKYRPANEESKKTERKARNKDELSGNGGKEMTDAASRHTNFTGDALAAFRIFRPPLAADVQLREKRPEKVFFLGTHGEVMAASGPWRTSGDWWREGVWDQEEWDLEIRFEIAANRRRNQALPAEHGLYRVYFDRHERKWFVRGSYD